MENITQQRLKKIMEERNLRQVDIINNSLPYQKKFNIKMSKNHLSNYINGRSTPDMKRMFLLSKTLGVPQDYLVGLSKFKSESDLMEGDVLGDDIFSILRFQLIESSSPTDKVPDSSNKLYIQTKEIRDIAFNIEPEERCKLESIIYNFLLLSNDERDDLVKYSEFVLSKKGYIVPDNKKD